MVANSTGTAAEAATSEKAGRSERLFALLQRHGALVVLVLVVAVAGFAFDRFLTFRNLENIVAQSAFLGLIAVGMTFVIISKGIDLSVGSLLALGGVLAAFSVQLSGSLALVVPVLACGAIGLLNGVLIAKAKMAPFIVTLAALLGVRGLVLAIAGERTIPISDAPVFTWFGRGDVLGIEVPIFFCIAPSAREDVARSAGEMSGDPSGSPHDLANDLIGRSHESGISFQIGLSITTRGELRPGAMPGAWGAS